MADEPSDQPAAAGEQPAGTCEISDNVIAKIAFEACRETEGVHALGGATSRALSNLRGGEHRTVGVSVDLRGDVVDLDITLVVAYGRSIPEVAQECREKVRERVEAITGLTVKAINVVVSDIYFPEAAPVDQGGQA
jgi:uncharacterized alkaline shock family protein YloU